MGSRDYFKSGSAWFWILQIVVNLYGLSIFAFFVLVENATALDTYFHNWAGTGHYYSLRYVSLYWVVLMLGTAKVFMFPMIVTLITYRRSKACSIAWFVVICIVAFLNMFVFFGLTTYFGSRNKAGQIDNPASSPLYCCLEEIYTVASNGCPNYNLPCTPVVTSLGVNTDFLWYYMVTLAYMLVDVFFVVFFCWVTCFQNQSSGAGKSVLPSKMTKDE